MSDLITLDDYKSYNTVTSDTKDSKISLLISAVSALVENHCNRKFELETHTEYHDAKQEVIYLKQFPLVEVVSVSVSKNGGLDYVDLEEDDEDLFGYIVDIEDGCISTQITKINFLNTYSTPRKSLKVVYSAGYTNIPVDLKLAVIDLVDYYKNNEHKPSMMIGGASLDNPMPYSSNRFPAHIQRVLDLYRLVT